MAIDWSHLPPEVIKAICMCPMANGFRLTPETGYFVHVKCMKPTIPTSVRECDFCGKTFVPQFHEKIKNEPVEGILCDVCDPPKLTSTT